MAVEQVAIDDFIKLARKNLVIDVRSPKEYQQAHYPGALSIPLFDDEERKVVGTTYKQKSREKAIKIGLDFFGPKMKTIVNQVEGALKKRNENTVVVYCWRGGMRSSAIAWLLDLYGFEVYCLNDGYKNFRNWVLAQFEKPYKIKILGGYTGSAKTEILLQLQAENHAVVDLEGIAGHKGSAFGNLNNIPQNSTEHFENKLALRLYELNTIEFKNPDIWVESESSRIGNVNIPHKFFNQMKMASRINIEVPFEKRLDFILEGYGQFDKEKLIAATQRVKKRLGGLETKRAIEFFEDGDHKKAFAILLKYYDKAYAKSRKRFCEASRTINLPNTNAKENAHLLLKKLKN